MNNIDISKYLLPLSEIPETEILESGGFTDKLPWFQGGLGSCGAMATARALSRVFGFPVSTLWIFILAKLAEDSFHTEGLTFNSLVYVSCEFGVIPEWMLTYRDDIDWSNKQALKNMLTPEMYEFAANHRVRGAIKLSSSLEIRKALSAKHPVIWGATISKDFRNDEDGHVLLSGISAGGHAMNLPNFDTNWVYKFDEYSQPDVGFQHIDQTWDIENRVWGDDSKGHISFRALDSEITIIPGQPGFKLWNECYAFVPFKRDYGNMIIPQRVVKLFIGRTDYEVDGISMISDVAPYIKDGRTMIPLRVVSEGLDFDVEWLESTRDIVIGDTFGKIKLRVGSTNIYMKSIVQKLDWVKSEMVMDVPVEIISGRSFVPARFISNKMSCEVEWDALGRSVTIKYYQ